MSSQITVWHRQSTVFITGTYTWRSWLSMELWWPSHDHQTIYLHQTQGLCALVAPHHCYFLTQLHRPIPWRRMQIGGKTWQDFHLLPSACSLWSSLLTSLSRLYFLRMWHYGDWSSINMHYDKSDWKWLQTSKCMAQEITAESILMNNMWMHTKCSVCKR